ncbi:hypothetical protein [Streptomyces sp. MB09-01]|uniref:DinB/UmuC family translesion DNA polymerase n=1 Tax=Streptomyces sp. MB09-01 TaxID=3028666 RepID=UPI003A5C16A1
MCAKWPAASTAGWWYQRSSRTARPRSGGSPSTPSPPRAVRAALLSLAVELGDRLRTRRQAARTITMTVTLADRSQVHRSRQLPGGPSAHTEDLRDTAYETPQGPNSSSCGPQAAV